MTARGDSGRRRLERRCQQGQATVEVVLVLPVVVLFVLVVVQVGLVVGDRLLLAHVAREAARAAAVEPDGSVATSAGRQATSLDPGQLSIELQGGRNPGDRLTVTARLSSRTDVPLVGPLLPDVGLSSSVTVRVE